MMKRSLIAIGVAVMLWRGSPAAAQPAATAPATAPATSNVRHVLSVPPGFQKVEINRRMFVLEPADEAWVRQAMESIEPTTLPTTMPSDLLGQLTVSREKIRSQMMHDLGITDPKVVETFFTEKLEPVLRRFDEINPPLFYLVTTRDRLKEILKNGWSDPRFYYNRVADSVQYSSSINLTTEGQADDILLPAVFDASVTPQEKSQALKNLIHGAEAGVAQSIAGRAMAVAQLAFVDFIFEQAVKPMKLNPQTEWFGVGLAGVLSSRYVSQVTGINLEQFLRNMTTADPRNPIRPATIDLLHPTPQADMRPQMIGAYSDAFRRRAARVVVWWIAQAPADAIPKTIAALQQNPPPDGETMLKQIKEASGVDLGEQVKPRM